MQGRAKGADPVGETRGIEQNVQWNVARAIRSCRVQGCLSYVDI
jgi:hypothetical protein